jgi:hypothetical protein
MKNSLRHLTILLLAAAVASPAAAAYWDDDCDEIGQRSASAPADGVKRVRVEARAGDLKIVGRPGAAKVEASGEACGYDAHRLAEVRLDAQRKGDEVVVTVTIPDGKGSAQLDLEVIVPAGAELIVDDTSGSMEITNVAALQVDDNSGEIEITDVAGDVTIDDNSGEIDVRNARGQVRVKDGSGEISIVDAGSVRIDSDGSGEITIERIAGDVYIDEDGSGSINVASIGGDFTVDDDGSGGIDHRDVRGKVTIPSRD